MTNDTIQQREADPATCDHPPSVRIQHGHSEKRECTRCGGIFVNGERIDTQTTPPPAIQEVLSLPFVTGVTTTRPTVPWADWSVTTTISLFRHNEHGREIENLGVTVEGVKSRYGDGGLLLYLRY